MYETGSAESPVLKRSAAPDLVPLGTFFSLPADVLEILLIILLPILPVKYTVMKI